MINNKCYRHELKFVLSNDNARQLKYLLSLIMSVDTNSKKENNTYNIRSLYFDDIYNNSYYDKINGVEYRQKYRIRLYDMDTKFIRLERKDKNRDLTYKEQARITKKQCIKFINRDFSGIDYEKLGLLGDFFIKYKQEDIRPSVIVEYDRLAYTYPVEEVRVTFDENIRSGRYNCNLFDKDIELFNVLNDNEVVLEVKFNNYIPYHIRKVLETIPMIRQAVSKFQLCDELKEGL